MRKYFLILAFLIPGFVNVAFAQEKDYINLMKSVLQTERKSIIGEVLELTEDEASNFWPLYEEYEANLNLTYEQNYKLVQEFANNYNNMTEEKSEELIGKFFDVDIEILKIRKSYIKKFSKVIPATKVAKFYQAENKIKALVDYELAKSIPFLE